MAKQLSRPDRWAAAVEAAQNKVTEAKGALEELRGIQEEYQDWLDGLAEVSEGTPMEEKLQAVCELELDEECDLDTMESTLDEAQEMELPRGFGRD